MPFPGGAERLIFNLARDLMRRGESVHVLTGYRDARQFDGPPFTAVPIRVRDRHDEGAQVIRATIDRFRPDVILTHHLYAYEFGDELLASGIPVVQVVLNTGRLDGIAFAVYISKFACRNAGGWKSGDMVILPPAFEDVIADRHGDAIGMIKPLRHKGIDLFYAIARRLRSRRFVVLRGEWQDLEVIREAPNIEFLEPVVDIRDFYARCRIVLMPSVSEDAGTVAQEAALNGLPCITSNVEGLIETNPGGIRLPPDREQWVHAIESLDDPDVYACLVADQRRHLPRNNLDEFAARIRGLAESTT